MGIRIAALAGGVVLSFGLTACGGDDDKDDKSGGASQPSGQKGGVPGGSAIAALKLASESTGKQDSAKVEGVNKMAGTDSTMTGDMEWSGGGMRANLTITQSGGQVTGSPMDGKPMDARYTTEAMYMNLGDAFAATAESGGKHWVKYDYDILAQKGGPAGAFLKDQLQNNNPARSVELLMATGQVKAVGQEDVKGVQATHYTGTLKVADLAKMQSKELTQDDLNKLQQQLQQTGTETETIDLWIDGNNLLVKKREYGKNNAGVFDSTVYYSDYGTQVTVEEPPVSDTLNFEDALPQQ